MNTPSVKHILFALAASLCAASSQAAAPSRTIDGAVYTRLPQKTNGSGIAVFHALSRKASVGQPLTLTLHIDALKKANTGEIRIIADPALGADTSAVQQALKQQAAVITLALTPKAQGLYYVKVFTQQGSRRSAAEIAVQVGTTKQKPAVNGTLVTGANGEKIIEMKSQ